MTLVGIPADAPSSTLEARVWDNYNGTLTSWDAAINITAPRGGSVTFDVKDIGGSINPPPALVGLTSFSVVDVRVPEPSVSVLIILGCAALCVRQRHKRGKVGNVVDG